MHHFTRKSIHIHGEEFVPYIDADRIQQRVGELAARLDEDFSGKNPIFICVLNGAFMFFADLIRLVTIECQMDFIRLASYENRMSPAGNVRLVKDIECDVRERHVVLVEDIVDTGASIDFAKHRLERNQPASISVVTLLHKPDRTEITHSLPYVGFTIPPRFVIGYGLDYGQLGRNLPAVYILTDNGAPPEG